MPPFYHFAASYTPGRLLPGHSHRPLRLYSRLVEGSRPGDVCKSTPEPQLHTWYTSPQKTHQLSPHLLKFFLIFLSFPPPTTGLHSTGLRRHGQRLCRLGLGVEGGEGLLGAQGLAGRLRRRLTSSKQKSLRG